LYKKKNKANWSIGHMLRHKYTISSSPSSWKGKYVVKELEEDRVILLWRNLSLLGFYFLSTGNNLRGRHVTDMNGYNDKAWPLEADDVLKLKELIYTIRFFFVIFVTEIIFLSGRYQKCCYWYSILDLFWYFICHIIRSSRKHV